MKVYLKHASGSRIEPESDHRVVEIATLEDVMEIMREVKHALILDLDVYAWEVDANGERCDLSITVYDDYVE